MPLWTNWHGNGIFDLLPHAASGAAPSLNIGRLLLGSAYCWPPSTCLERHDRADSVSASLPICARRGAAASTRRSSGGCLHRRGDRRLSGAGLGPVSARRPDAPEHRGPTSDLARQFWLAVHVVTIIASYTSAGLALILGNFALAILSSIPNPQSRIPLRAAAAQLSLIRRSNTVLLLAASTVIGEIWADDAGALFGV